MAEQGLGVPYEASDEADEERQAEWSHQREVSGSGRHSEDDEDYKTDESGHQNPKQSCRPGDSD